MYNTTPQSGSDVYSSFPVTADVINTSDLRSFSAYGVEACYRFHGYHLRDVAQVDLGAGIAGQVLSYSTKHQDWTVVYWVWPVKSGSNTRYERVMLFMLDTTGATIKSPGLGTGIKSLNGALSGQDNIDKQLRKIRTFLVSFAREVVKAQTVVKPGTTLVRHIILNRGGHQISIVPGQQPIVNPARAAAAAAAAAAKGTRP
jgi:hypothetical protein